MEILNLETLTSNGFVIAKTPSFLTKDDEEPERLRIEAYPSDKGTARKEALEGLDAQVRVIPRNIKVLLGSYCISVCLSLIHPRIPLGIIK